MAREEDAGSALAFERLGDGNVTIRSATSGVVLEFTAEEWTAFVAGVRDGEFAPVASPL